MTESLQTLDSETAQVHQQCLQCVVDKTVRTLMDEQTITSKKVQAGSYTARVCQEIRSVSVVQEKAHIAIPFDGSRA